MATRKERSLSSREGKMITPLLVVACLAIAVVVSVELLVTPGKVRSPRAKAYPDAVVRQAVGGITAHELDAVLLDLPGQAITVRDQDEMASLLAGLRSAVLPWNPKDPAAMPPGNRICLVTLRLTTGRKVGPFPFGLDSPNHAFGAKFAQAYNRVAPADRRVRVLRRRR